LLNLENERGDLLCSKIMIMGQYIKLDIIPLY